MSTASCGWRELTSSASSANRGAIFLELQALQQQSNLDHGVRHPFTQVSMDSPTMLFRVSLFKGRSARLAGPPMSVILH